MHIVLAVQFKDKAANPQYVHIVSELLAVSQTAGGSAVHCVAIFKGLD